MSLAEIPTAAPQDPRAWLWVATLVYASGFGIGIFFARKGKGIPGMGFLGFVLVGFAIQTRGLYFRGMDTHACPLGNGMEQLQFIAWSFVVTYLLIRFIFKLHLLGLFTTGLATALCAVSLIASGLDTHYWQAPAYNRLFNSPWIELHAAVAVFSYGIFALLAMVAIMYLVQHQALRRKETSPFLRYLPSIQQLEQSAEKLLLMGVLFLTFSVVVGAIHFSRDPAGVTPAKLWVTIGVWVAYLAMFVLHRTGRLYAKRFSQISIAAFAFALVSMVTVNKGIKDTSDPGKEAPAQHE